jgi:hypothetical protein
MSTLDRDRLGKLLEMLGSDHDGEVVNAARAADRLVRASGLRWPDIAMPAPPGSPRDPIEFCLSRHAVLTAWESIPAFTAIPELSGDREAKPRR